MIILLILLISQTNALYSKKTYNTRGFNAIDINLENYNELNKGSTTINIILENNSITAIPFLSYCYTKNKQTIKSIMSSSEELKKQIETNKKICVFDNTALLYSQRIQQITLSDQLDDENEFAYNKFSIYKLKEKQISIYVYSPNDAQYTITIKGSQNGECYNQCNNNGLCMSNQILFCQCNEGYLDSTCQLYSTVVNAPSLVQFEMKQQSYKNILTIPLKAQSTQLQIEVNSTSKIITYLGCQYNKEFIPFYLSNSFYLTEISTGLIKFSKSEIQYCKDNLNKMESNFGQKFENYVILLLVNDQNIKPQVELKLYLENDEDNNSGLEIYYILGGTLGALIVTLLLIICIIYFQRKTRRINNGNQNNLSLRSNAVNGNTLKILNKDYLPVELYEQIIQEYPGLVEISDCQICLVEFQKQDLVKLTYCLHLFHSTCIDEWKKRNQTCPFCREDLIKKKSIQQKQEQNIYQLGVIQGDVIQMDAQKLVEFQKREQRLKHLQQTSSPDSANAQQLKENTPSPFSKGDSITQKLCLQQQ